MDMALFNMFLTVVIAHFLALLSPGPDFVLVVKSAVKNGNHKSVGVAAGIASANAVYITVCLVGMGSILAGSLTLLIGLKTAGGIFLIYLAVQALKAKKESYSDLAAPAAFTGEAGKSDTTFAKEFVTGFMSGILNPKNLLFYLSLFTVVLTKEVDIAFKLALGVWMTLVVFLWDLFIIYLLSTRIMRRKFSGFAYYIDKLTGAVLGMIGFTIVKSALIK